MAGAPSSLRSDIRYQVAGSWCGSRRRSLSIARHAATSACPEACCPFVPTSTPRLLIAASLQNSEIDGVGVSVGGNCPMDAAKSG